MAIDKENNSSVEQYQFEPIKGYPMLNWQGKRPFHSTQYYPAQLKEVYGKPVDGWDNEIYWGDNLQVMSHLLKEYRGKINLIYIDPPFDSKADYKKKIELKGEKISNDYNSFEEKQYGDIWTNDEYLQFMYERLILIHELLSENGSIYLHCDSRKSHHLHCLLDEIFGAANLRNEIIWYYSTLGRPVDRFAEKHDNIFCYGKTNKAIFNSNEIKIPYTEEYIESHFRDKDEKGKKCRKRYDAGKWRIYYPEDGMIPNDVWEIPYENSMSKDRTGYPTQKPKNLLERIIIASSNPGDIVFDCFMGSGTTQAVAMKLGRRFIGADINLGAIQTTTKRLIEVAQEIEDSNKDQLEIKNNKNESENRYTSFSVFNVNNYDFFKNPIEAKELLIEAFEIQPMPKNSVYDGEKDGYMVKIMPVNRIATRRDLNELITNFDYKTFNRRKNENPTKPVEKILLISMGHELDLAAQLKEEMKEYEIEVKIVDVLRDKANLEFKRDSEAKVAIKKGKFVIENFYPMNLLQKLSLLKKDVSDWRKLVESVMIDWNHDGNVLKPVIIDVPEPDELVKGEYPVPDDAKKIKVKITDLLSESWEGTIDA